ncbi:beta-lactamase family protein [Streptomyces sp. RS10V-4]|uniref:serine hydrolase domain-containing protein n=1 Tax=Streptomyces rhizoryzae TaxID=2932493 RepID=UPI0020030A1E|nr:serine hydrolase domain-containing protein [Streptomyces rhizoryzae]MCK7621633.1 beta-lactamase family protein [Streptomyces rhizoryzae]
MSDRQLRRLRSTWRPLVGLLAAATVVGVAGAVPASAAPSAGPKDGVRAGLEQLIKDDGYPAALASTTNQDGQVHNYTAGVGDLRTKAKVPVDGRVRAGSNTKTFTAVVVLQLVAEGKVELDAPIERYLPGLVRGEGIDGRKITVRQLLRHTSGLPNYTEFLSADPFGEDRHRYYQPRDLLDVAFAHKALFAPGAKWSYSNTNYIVAGLLIERVTGRPFAEQVSKRVVEPLGLRHTYVPAEGEEEIQGAHPRGYHASGPGGAMNDVTELDPSWGWAAGSLVTSPSDLNRFFSALLGGRLLKPAQLAQMKTTVRMPDRPGAPTEAYGLGLIRTQLSCGKVAWGHGGKIPGFYTYPRVTEDGRATSIAVTALSTDPKADQRVQALADKTLCAK